MKKEEYMTPKLAYWNIQTECGLCGSVVKDGAEIGGLEKDDDFEWL